MKDTIMKNFDDKLEQYTEDLKNIKFEVFEKRKEILNIQIEQINDYKKYIVDKYKFEYILI